jgi:hypothetical protein
MLKSHFHVLRVGSKANESISFMSEADAQDELADLEDIFVEDMEIPLDVDRIPDYTIVEHDSSHKLLRVVDVLV